MLDAPGDEPTPGVTAKTAAMLAVIKARGRARHVAGAVATKPAATKPEVPVNRSVPERSRPDEGGGAMSQTSPGPRELPACEQVADLQARAGSLVLDAMDLPDDNSAGPMAFDLRAGAALPPGCATWPWSVCWPKDVGWWTSMLPPALGRVAPEGTIRVAARTPAAVTGRWSRLAGMSDGGAQGALYWVIALGPDGSPLGVWATSPARGVALAEVVAGPGVQIPDKPVWVLTAGVPAPAAELPVAPVADQRVESGPGEHQRGDEDLTDPW